ncbi:MAG TPA: creatininase family protein [Candidatus Latescibacteria bacterium]|nr:creatininase family protein [Candidatus Latescibacterota bacterium]
MEPFLLEGMSYEEVGWAVEAGAVALAPVGSLEQHGRHLPLGTDSRIVTHIAHEAAKRASEKVRVVVAPTVWLGCSHHHMEFPGTLSLDREAFIGVIKDVGRCLARHGFRRVLFLNGHRGNSNPLKVAVDQLRDELGEGVLVALVTYWELNLGEDVARMRDSAPGGISHAGEMETSCMLYLEPELVRRERQHRFVPRWKTRNFGLGWYEPSPVYLGFHVRDFSETGEVGDPTVATAEKGRKFLELAAERVAEFLVEFASWSMPDLYEGG